MATALKKYRQLSDGSVYADPNEPDYSVRFKTTSAPKSLNGLKTTNYITEIIVNDLNDVTISGQGAVDPVSIRIRVSGAVESHARMGAILQNVAGSCATWVGENVLLGFDPVTAPVDYT
jgi:hypothetical protein